MDKKTDILKEISQSTGEFLPLFSLKFQKVLSSEDPIIGNILENVTRGEGKHIRPLLLALSHLLAGGEISEKVVDVAILLELLHSASLIHDDVIDDSSERRGIPTLNQQYNNRTAVLVGDYILALSFSEAVKNCDPIITQTLAYSGLILSMGEIYQEDSSLSKKFMTRERYFQIIRRKTGILFEAATFFGGHLAEASEETLKLLKDLGSFLGTAFQLKDDLFDYFTQNSTGKPAGLDLEEGKVTLPLIYAYEVADNQLRIKMESLLSEAPSNPKSREKLIDLAFSSGGVEDSTKYLKSILAEAKRLILSFPDSCAQKSLLKLCDFLFLRTY